MNEPLTRRGFLGGALIAAGGSTLAFQGGLAARPAAAPLAGAAAVAAGAQGTPRVAAIITEYRPWSHADVIVGRFIQGYSLDVSPHWPPVSVRSMYIDQFPETDLSRPLSRRYGIPIARTIREAILGPGGEVAVDGVVLIGEHGDYPRNDREQILYPRRRFFDESVDALVEGKRIVPVFNDKHLAARWEDARAMYARAREHSIPFLAGSSLPLAWRRPWLEIPLGSGIDEALSVGYGDTEAYGYHALEALQCMIERRRGGESGVAAVQCIEGPGVWEAMRAGRFSRDLLVAALRTHEQPLPGEGMEERCPKPIAFFIEHTDGLRSTCLVLNGLSSRFLFAARLAGCVEPVACEFWLQEPTFGHFSYLSNAIIEMLRTGKPPYPVERTVIATGVLSAAMDSRFEKGRRIETPELKIPYQPADHDLGAYRHPEAANARSGGWIDLVASFEAWRIVRQADSPEWRVLDGVLRGSGGGGYVATCEEYGDIELFAELRVTGSAAGSGAPLAIRARPEARDAAEGSGVWIVCSERADGPPQGSVTGLAAAKAAEARDGAWSTLRLKVRGETIRTWWNGEPAAEGRLPAGSAARGAVLLRVEEGETLELRELRVRRLR